MEKGRELPSWYLEEPQLETGDDFYLRAFWRLSSCRSNGMSLGRIPWTASIQYGYHAGLDDDMIDVFLDVVHALDTEYLAWQSEEAKRNK